MVDLPNHFFKFIPPGFKFNLSIPKSFLSSLSGWKCKTATVRRGRHKWPVHVTDKGFFGDGWRKFVIDNGVQDKDFIVFKHQGNMVFDFFVFDQSTCERQYPGLFEDVEKPLTQSHSLQTHKKSNMVGKRKRTDYSTRNKDTLLEKAPVSNSTLFCRKVVVVGKDRCFVTVMTPYYIRTTRLHVPMKFARSTGLITKRMRTRVVLVDEAKRTWPATLQIKRNQVRLTGGRKLVIKNDLKVGDACMFELVKAGEVPVFNFYNLGKKPTKNLIQVKKKVSSKIRKKAASASRYFLSTLKQYSFKKTSLFLPVDFSISNDLRKGEMILRDDKGRSWKVQLNKTGQNIFFLGRGLKEFWAANGLTNGDAYKFELVENKKKTPPVVNFSVIGKKHVKNHNEIKKNSSKIKKASGSSIHNHAYNFVLDENEDDKEKGNPPIMSASLNVNTTDPSGSIEDYSYYIGKMKSYHIEKSMLYFPREFARKNRLLNKETMILKTVDKRSWTVEIKCWRKKDCYIVGQGWKEFRVANGLKEGDLFKLELVSNGEIPVAYFYHKLASS